MARKKKHQQHSEEEGGEAWLLPYSDLMTLLLAVFIVLFAVSKIDVKQAEQMAAAFRENMMADGAGVLSGEGDTAVPIFPDAGASEQSQENTSANNAESTNSSGDSSGSTDKADVTDDKLAEFLGNYELQNLKDLKAELDAKFAAEDMAASVSTKIDMRGLVVSLNNAILFESGSAEIKKENESTLLSVAELINSLDNYIRIEGHTDNVPISSDLYASNWELSTARAASVVRLFIDKGKVSPEKLVAVGYGEYKPIAGNDTAEGRAKNRRIDIIVLSEKYNNLED